MSDATVAAAVDAVEESEGLPNLDEWASREDEPKPEPQEAKPEKPEAKAPKAAPKKGADAIAAAAEKGKAAAEAKERAPAPAPKPAAKPAPYDPQAKVKIVIDGEEEEITIDEALRRARKNSAADRRFQEAAKLRQEAESLKPLERYKGLLSDGDFEKARALAAERGLDFADPKTQRALIAEVVVLEQIEREKLEKENPSELKRREAEAKLRDLEAKQKAEEEKRQAEERRQAAEKIREGYNKTFAEALQRAELPATPYTVMRMAELMQENLRMGLELTPAEIAPLVREDLTKETASVIGRMDVPTALKVLPKGFLDALRKYDLEQARSGQQKAAPKTTPPTALAHVERRPRREKVTRVRDAEKALEAWAEGR